MISASSPYPVGGETLAQLIIEACLASAPGVAAAYVVPVPHEVRGENVGAFLVQQGAAKLDLEAILAHCRREMASYKVPRHLFLLAVELRLVEVLGRDRALHLLNRDADALVDFAELFAVAGLAQLGPCACLVEQIDGLIRQEPIRDVPVRLVDRRFDGFALDTETGVEKSRQVGTHLARLVGQYRGSLRLL